jgi:phospholipid/cholesterol/gamma-HCH transport system substrate-binding protein
MNSELKVGMLFLVVVALIMTFTVFTTPSLRKRGAYEVTFPRVQRLKAGDPVTFNGVRVGSVSAVDPVLKSDGTAAVAVVFSVDEARKKTVLVGPETRYTIRQGILGGAELEILSLVGAPITPEATKQATGSEPVGVDEAVASVQKLVEENRAEIQKAIVALREGMVAFGEMSGQVRDAVKENRDQLRVTLKNIGDAAGSIDGTITENRENIKGAIVNIRTMADRIATVVGENREQIRVLIETFSKAGVAVEGAASEIKGAVAENRPALKQTIGNAGIISEQIASGQGSIGKLVMEDTAHDKLEMTLDSAQARLEEVKPLTQGLTELKFYGGLSGGRNLNSGVAIGEAYLRIEPRPWKFYEAGVVYRTAGKDRDTKTDDPDKLNADFNLQIGWRWLKDDDRQRYHIGISGGLLESRVGARAWWNITDALALNGSIRQAHNTRQPNDRRYEPGDVRARVTLDWTLWERVSLSVGGDDLTYKPGLWLGLRGEILDNDLRNLFSAAIFLK